MAHRLFNCLGWRLSAGWPSGLNVNGVSAKCDGGAMAYNVWPSVAIGISMSMANEMANQLA